MSLGSAGFEINFPDVSYNKDFQQEYTDLVNPLGKTIFAGRNRANVFIYAMVLAISNGVEKKSIEKGKKAPNLPPDAFTDEMRWYMRTVAITDSEDLEIFLDHRKVLDIAESYANAGFPLVLDLVNKTIPGEDIEAIFETALRDQVKNRQKKN